MSLSLSSWKQSTGKAMANKRWEWPSQSKTGQPRAKFMATYRYSGISCSDFLESHRATAYVYFEKVLRILAKDLNKKPSRKSSL